MITFIICLMLLVASYFTYGRYLERAFGVDVTASVPSKTHYDGVDYLPLPMWKTFLIQLLNIAGLGPIFGALIGATFGPVAFLWITFGGIFIGAVQDYASGIMSMKMNGLSFPEIVGRYLGTGVKQVMRTVTLLLMVLVGAVFIVGPAGILESMTGITQNIWVWIVFGYYILATVLPIDKIMGRVYPIFGAALFIMAFGILFALLFGDYKIPDIGIDTSRNMKTDGASFPVMPVLFITIACGAVSGFHATQSPLMARCMTSQRQGRPVFFGAMISESVIALIWAAMGMAFWNGAEGLNDALAAHGDNAAWAVSVITDTTLGKIGAALAMLGVVVAPITSGDSAFRGARLIAADFLHLEQRSIRKRLYISIPLFVAGFAITLMDFGVIWQYFAWLNQALAAICLFTIAVWMTGERKSYIRALIPSLFMTYVITLYILIAREGFRIDYATGSVIAGTVTILTLTAFIYYKRKSRNLKNLK